MENALVPGYQAGIFLHLKTRMFCSVQQQEKMVFLPAKGRKINPQALGCVPEDLTHLTGLLPPLRLLPSGTYAWVDCLR
jgi:hypothetical protein